MGRALVGLVIGLLFSPGLLPAQEDARLAQRAVAYWAVTAAATVVVQTPASSTPEMAACGAVMIAPDRALTAQHCVGGRTIAVRMRDGTQVAVTVERQSVGRDLAVLRLARAVTVPRVPVVSTNVAIGDTVWVVGAPLGEEFVLTRGVISKLIPNGQFRSCEEPSELGATPQQIVMYDAMMAFGNSGGPVFDDRANLIGITVRVRVWQATCTFPGTQMLWGFAVGPQALKAFLEGSP